MAVWHFLIIGGIAASWWSIPTALAVIAGVIAVRAHISLDLPHLYIAMCVIWASAAFLMYRYDKSVAACLAIVSLTQAAHLLGLVNITVKFALGEFALVLALILGASNGNSTGIRDLLHRLADGGRTSDLVRREVPVESHRKIDNKDI